MSREVEDGMGFSGLAPTAEERRQDAYEDTRRKVARARENALATAVAQVGHLRAVLTLAEHSLMDATGGDEYGEYDDVLKTIRAALASTGPLIADDRGTK